MFKLLIKAKLDTSRKKNHIRGFHSRWLPWIEAVATREAGKGVIPAGSLYKNGIYCMYHFMQCILHIRNDTHLISDIT